jgi:hypothetical protein
MGDTRMSLKYLNMAILLSPGWGDINNLEADSAFKEVIKELKSE